MTIFCGCKGQFLSLDDQIQKFESVVKELRKEFKNQAEFSQHLSKAVFYISTGSNDYGLGYLFPQTGLSQKFTDKTFAQLLSQQLTLRLQVEQSSKSQTKYMFCKGYQIKLRDIYLLIGDLVDTIRHGCKEVFGEQRWSDWVYTGFAQLP